MLDIRKTSLPINKSHWRKSSKTMNVRGNVANAGSPAARNLMLLTTLFQGIFRNQKLFVLVTMSYLMTHEMPDRWAPSLVLLTLSCPLHPASPQLARSDRDPAGAEDMVLTIVLHTLDVAADNGRTGNFRLVRPHWNNMARLSCNAKLPNPLQMYWWVICFEINCTLKQMSHIVMFACWCWPEI